jgi:hypothetical protein
MHRRNEDLLDYMEFTRQPYLFSSETCLKILDTTTSIRTKLVLLEMIGPRLTDPKAKMDQILGLFRFAEEKSKVEEILKARSATLLSSMFKATPSSTSSKQNSPTTRNRKESGLIKFGKGRGLSTYCN